MSRRLTLADLDRLAVAAEPALAPGGESVVYVLRGTDPEADRDVRQLWRVEAEGGTDPVRLTAGPDDRAPAFSPRGERVAFLRGEVPQLWTVAADGGQPEQLTELPLGAGSPRWSPDGSRIAFAAPLAGASEDGAAPVVIDRCDYKADGDGLRRGRVRQLFVLTLASGELRQVSFGERDASDPSWSPDGERLAFAAAESTAADLTRPSAAFVVDLAPRTPRSRRVGETGGNAGAIAWSPDGEALLVAGRRVPGRGNLGLLRVPLDGGATTSVAADLDRNVMAGEPGYPGARPAFVGGGPEVAFCARDGGCTHLYLADAAPGAGGGARKLLDDSETVVTGLSLSADGRRAALTLATPRSFGEVALLDLDGGEPRPLTAHTSRSLPEVELLAPEARQFTVGDGTVVHGWVLRDPAAPQPAPLLLDVHGGPHNAWSPVADAVHAYHQLLAAEGWVVLTLNPRGSDGYGDEFRTAATGGWGIADERDLLEPLDQLVADGVADRERLALSGYSYGGFMTCHLTTRTERFAAAVAGGVICDAVSLAGTSDDGAGMARREFAAPLLEGRAALRDQSPLERAEHVRTPTLILQGTDDERCPLGQAEQWFAALREGGVPSRLVVYPDASHLFVSDGRPSHRADYARRLVAWVREHAEGRPAPIDAAHWQRRLTELSRKHGLPGAALGILRLHPDGEEELVEAAHGVLNKASGAPVTTDSAFQIGSITKVWVATQIMMLVEAGKLDLDAPVADVLPELRLPDPELARRVTLRHLLAHTSGIGGDVFDDTGEGDDCVERFVALLAEVPLTHPLGATFSYCNAGFVVAGRVIERLTGTTWEEALRAQLLEPLGLRTATTRPAAADPARTAVGHIGAEREPAEPWVMPLGSGPAGGTLAMSAADLLAFVRMHLRGGLAADGSRLLSPESVAAMQEQQIEPAARTAPVNEWGLGWMRLNWEGRELIGHDGGTIGQNAFLRIVPDAGFAVTVLTNSIDGAAVYLELFDEILAELAGVEMPAPLEPPPSPPAAVDLERHLGTYGRTSERIEVVAGEGGGLQLRRHLDAEVAGMLGTPAFEEHELLPFEDDVFVTPVAEGALWTSATFYALPDGTRYLHLGLRANPRAD